MDRLTGAVQHYAWGSVEEIPRLLRIEPDGRPHAELWLGTHPAAPSYLDRDGSSRRLDELVLAAPTYELGDVAGRGQDLPFLLKVLAAARPLSIQAHPTQAQAEAGYDREESAGIALTAPERIYRDRNHKPELLCAIGKFRALCGFRRPADAAADMRALRGTGLTALAAQLEQGPEDAAIRATVGDVLTMPPAEQRDLVDELTRGLQEPIVPRALVDWIGPIVAEFPGDIGAVVALLLHRIELELGEAVFLSAGCPHAYLSGLGVEVMANSDNVVRGGLTPKHIDVPELLRVLDFQPTMPPLVPSRPERPGVYAYDTAATEFALLRVDLDPRLDPVEIRGPAIVLSIDATINEVGPGRGKGLGPGQAAFVAAATPIMISGQGTAFVAGVGAR
jgi:mannose-6-phosphate isomerase